MILPILFLSHKLHGLSSNNLTCVASLSPILVTVFALLLTIEDPFNAESAIFFTAAVDFSKYLTLTLNIDASMDIVFWTMNRI